MPGLVEMEIGLGRKIETYKIGGSTVLLLLSVETVGNVLNVVVPVTYRYVTQFVKPGLEGLIGPLCQSICLSVIG